jgi:hypothetical protein
MIGDSPDRFSFPAITSRWIGESVLSDFNGLRRHFRAALSDLNAEARSRVAHEKREAGLSSFLKNNTRSQPAGQEIVDFSYRASQP